MRLEVFVDGTRNILSKNDSPDVGFTWSVNPYRGCFHACAYCYARPTHEYLSFGAGTDFDRKIVLKPNAPALLREAFAKKSWRRETVVFSGVTDCYQPLEASYRLTRGCLEVCVERANPAAIITKSPLVERDVDVLPSSARRRLAVTVSIPFWDDARRGPSSPTSRRRRAGCAHRDACAGRDLGGRECRPIIPGLNDEDGPDILEAARDAGATRPDMCSFDCRVGEGGVHRALARGLPLRAERVLNRILLDARRPPCTTRAFWSAAAARVPMPTRFTRCSRRRRPATDSGAGAIPSDVQVDAQDARKTCMSIAMPAAMTAGDPTGTEPPPVAEKPPLARPGQLELPLLR